jgi:hypothetical protein
MRWREVAGGNRMTSKNGGSLMIGLQRHDPRSAELHAGDEGQGLLPLDRRPHRSARQTALATNRPSAAFASVTFTVAPH